jgi:hypothetical protein
MLLRILSAASHSFSSKPMLAAFELVFWRVSLPFLFLPCESFPGKNPFHPTPHPKPANPQVKN